MKSFRSWANQLKNSRESLIALIIVNGVWAVLSIYVDMPWLLSVPRHLIPFTPICSLYPLLLFVWYILRYFKVKIPGWYTNFTFIGISIYGILAQVYFPLLMSWTGVNFHDVASMFWVAVYGLQAFVLASELKPLKTHQWALIGGYFVLKDISDYFYKTFVDFLLPHYPELLMNFIAIFGLTVQVSIFLLTLRIVYGKK
jgi:hypothetical protein